MVTPEYFETFGIRMLHGRALNAHPMTSVATCNYTGRIL
jgi:hypothetical protein